MSLIPKIREKRWNPSLEEKIFEKWQKDGIFHFNEKSRKPLFSIDTPPPYVNTPVHIGHDDINHV
ncbi:MAG: class I tRNA ligase family protein [Nitrososphaerales archaeon]